MQTGNKAPVWRLPKKTIVAMAKWKCEHSHSGLEHYACWLKANPGEERLGFLDIETTNLKADFGIILSYAIADDASDNVFSKTVTKNELRTCLDEKIVKSCIKDMLKFDRLVTYYGTKFDIPFLRTRAVALGLEFPEYGTLIHNDLYYAVRMKLCISSNRLDNACRTVFGETEKTRIDADHWIKALMGDSAALDYIHDHNVRDVQETKRLYHKLENYRRKTDTTI